MPDQASEWIEVPGFPPIPRGPYDLVAIDPPWSFEVWSSKGESRSAKNHYDTLTEHPLASLPLREITTKDSLVLLWTTWPHLAQAIRLLDIWGFPYSTGEPWIKREPTGKPSMITGYYWRHVSEPLLLGKRKGGRALERIAHDVRGVLDTLKPVAHSRKPQEFYQQMDALFGTNIRRLDMFARAPHPPGWDVWGLEADPDDRHPESQSVPPRALTGQKHRLQKETAHG